MITGLYAALLAALFIALSINVIKARRSFKVALGDNDHPVLKQRMRCHANFAEYTPLFLIILGLTEYQGLPWYGVHLLGLLFLAGRLFHAYGVGFAEKIEDRKLMNSRFRVRGMGLTFATLSTCVVVLIVQYVWSMIG